MVNAAKINPHETQSTMRLTEVAQHWLAEIIQEGDVVVDTTLGNGFDALFLAQKSNTTNLNTEQRIDHVTQNPCTHPI